MYSDALNALGENRDAVGYLFDLPGQVSHCFEAVGVPLTVVVGKPVAQGMPWPPQVW